MKRSLLLFLIQLLASVSFFLATIIVARYLGSEKFGDFSAAYSVASVAYIICLLGADITAINVIAIAVKAKENGVVKAFFVYVFSVVGLLTVFYYIIAFIGYWVSKDILLFKNPHPVFVAVIFIPFMALSFFFYRVLIGFSKPVLANVIYKIIINFSMLFLAALMFFDESFRNSYAAVVLFMVPWVIAFVVMFYLLFKRMRLFFTKTEEIEYTKWLSSGLSGLPYTLALFTVPYLAIIGAEVFLANEGSVGVFATSASFSQLIANIFLACIQSIALTPIAIAINDNDLFRIRDVFNKNLAAMSIASFIIVLLTIVFGRDVLFLYGKDYIVGENILLIFMVMQCVIMSGCLAAPTLIYMKKNKFVVSSSLLLMILLVITVSIFGYIYQETGIALAVLLSVTIVFVAQSCYAYKLTFESSE
ncbi:hypothetical protein [Francisella adeliensis]|uniref:Polysaccharide biosynthesis protein C-terminal domain-containing protein n=1 Tax=Francisella adeliensis TaxID=2007306 RepID=A0A2Z4Y129_9GAMM|nr:hypothetical protein [Francisella adeliensis]AXA34432.1 hypothetical protein CDH04_08500 [Francisella adeliensis]MBK2086526.1 hypothetical protein [Francisella adeliensis]MBK2096154.1 hypothetical protein [Francisella adeliensis]QIW12679.1 hypothetical protein FZC43_08505 [Francisella adeliensis]QIW14555.1 hypothetical protein FZC44_08500 [Francisella adeliensis]